MSGTGTTLVIGATGTTGSRTAARLLAGGHRVRAAGRRGAPWVDAPSSAAEAAGAPSSAAPSVGAESVGTPSAAAESVRFDWYDPATFADAVAGADRVYLVPPVGEPDPLPVMLPFLRRARAAGVRRAVLLSSSAVPEGGPAVGQVHRALPELFEEWAVLRPSWFMQNFTGEHLHARSIREHGTILTAAGAGRVGFVDAEDIAAVAAHALTDERAPDRDLVLTGPEALSHDAVAAVVAEVTGRPVVHHRLTHGELRERLSALMPPAFAGLLADLDRAIAAGAEDRTTDTVRLLTGRAPNGFRQVFERELTAGR
ncbi:ergot alkaloid biosynthesis protein [Kitasatospora sp. NPDC004745]|uniref:ergot alkaloid biosynthesis protein n=1 Tax=Kitasatospora sp. NPDC004745 TaxID=3364019 RepID=UPI0036C6F11A